MLLNKGELDGARILSPASIELMDTNAITHEALAKSPGIGTGRFNENVGFGLDFRVVMEPRRAGLMEGKNSMDWGGAAGTWFWIDPVNDLAFVGMIQMQGGYRPGGLNFRADSAKLVYAALSSETKSTQQ